jgi:hypothetical protein
MKSRVFQPFRAPRQRKEKATKHTSDSEEPTEQGLEWRALIIKETQYTDTEDVIDNGVPDINDRGKHYAIEARVERSSAICETQPAIVSTAASPSCSKFEAFLATKSVSASVSEASVSARGHRKISNTDAFWDNVLESEKRRLASNAVDRLVPVDNMMLDNKSDDDDV